MANISWPAGRIIPSWSKSGRSQTCRRNRRLLNSCGTTTRRRPIWSFTPRYTHTHTHTRTHTECRLSVWAQSLLSCVSGESEGAEGGSEETVVSTVRQEEAQVDQQGPGAPEGLRGTWTRLWQSTFRTECYYYNTMTILCVCVCVCVQGSMRAYHEAHPDVNSDDHVRSVLTKAERQLKDKFDGRPTKPPPWVLTGTQLTRTWQREWVKSNILTKWILYTY